MIPDMMNKLVTSSLKKTTSLTKCAKQHCSLWLPRQWLRTDSAGRRDLDNYAKVRCMIDDPPDVDQLKLREMTSDFAEEASEGGSDTSSVQKLAESLSAIVETLNSASKGRAKEKAKKGSVDPGLLHGRTVAGNIAETACGGKPPDVATVCGNRESH